MPTPANARHAALYVRVTTGMLGSRRAQEAALRAWAAPQRLPVRWYRDEGAGPDRPGWEALWAAVLAGSAAAVAVRGLDRLGRTAAELVALFDDLAGRGVRLVSLDDGIADVGTAPARRAYAILSRVAVYEGERDAEYRASLVAGAAAARARGVTLGRPKGSRRPSKLTPEVVARVGELKAAGWFPKAIAAEVGLTRQSVYNALALAGGGGSEPDGGSDGGSG